VALLRFTAALKPANYLVHMMLPDMLVTMRVCFAGAGWLNLIAQLSGNAAQTALMADLTITLCNMVAAYNGTEPPEFSKGEQAAWLHCQLLPLLDVMSAVAQALTVVRLPMAECVL
jgi:hypothetical protein